MADVSGIFSVVERKDGDLFEEAGGRKSVGFGDPACASVEMRGAVRAGFSDKTVALDGEKSAPRGRGLGKASRQRVGKAVKRAARKATAAVAAGSAIWRGYDADEGGEPVGAQDAAMAARNAAAARGARGRGKDRGGAREPAETPTGPEAPRRPDARGASSRAVGRDHAESARKRAGREVVRARSRAEWREAAKRAEGAKQAVAAAAEKAEEAAVAGMASRGTRRASFAALAPAAGTAGAWVLAAMTAVLVVTCLLATFATVEKYEEDHRRNGGEMLARIALAEYESGAADGTYHYKDSKYWNETANDILHYGTYSDGGSTPWCSCFVTWCWNKCGFDKVLGLPSGFPMASSWLDWVADDSSKGVLIRNDGSWIPKPGDIVVVGEPHGYSQHVGIVVAGLDERGQYTVVDGNAWSGAYEGPGDDSVGKKQYFRGSYWTWVCRPNYPNAGGTELMAGVDFNMSERAFVREWAPRIDAFFASYNPSCPLNGKGELFARAAYEYKYDPRLSPAIAVKESSGGVYCIRPYNAWGWGAADSDPYGLAWEWSSWQEAIYAHVRGLSIGYSNMTLEQIAEKYCSTPDTWLNEPPGVRDSMARI